MTIMMGYAVNYAPGILVIIFMGLYSIQIIYY